MRFWKRLRGRADIFRAGGIYPQAAADARALILCDLVWHRGQSRRDMNQLATIVPRGGSGKLGAILGISNRSQERSVGLGLLSDGCRWTSSARSGTLLDQALLVRGDRGGDIQASLRRRVVGHRIAMAFAPSRLGGWSSRRLFPIRGRGLR